MLAMIVIMQVRRSYLTKSRRFFQVDLLKKMLYLFKIEIEKQFDGLRITEFPLYVQGLEFRDDSENPENNDPRGVIISHEHEGSTGKNKLQKI